ncbi:NUDIX hydrolase [Shumkonia mesophila]|uniref:NUDIX hydrolase n=1 Tax=Shumkonia mesophila TaxID=2838854 RepID=UPI002934BF04|nr:NUDIX hydrolase [Shumkonia mesophila]
MRDSPPPPWYYRQSGVIPYRYGADGPEVLLITSRTRKRWILPKGVVEPGLDAVASAANEAFEEAGVKGRLAEPSVGSFAYAKWEGICTVEVFAMTVEEVLDDWPERAERTRRWLPLAEAAGLADDPGASDLIRRLGETLAAGA